MKKVLILLVVMISLVSCSDSKTEAKIKQLETDKKELQNKLEQTKQQLETAGTTISDYETQIKNNKQLVEYTCTFSKYILITNDYDIKGNGYHSLLGWIGDRDGGSPDSKYGHGYPVAITLTNEQFKLVQINKEFRFKIRSRYFGPLQNVDAGIYHNPNIIHSEEILEIGAIKEKDESVRDYRCELLQ